MTDFHDDAIRAHDEDPVAPLSPDGLRRRDAMLAQLRGEVVRVHRARVRRRRAVGAGATLGVLAIATGAIWLGVRPGATSPATPAPAPSIAQNDADPSSPAPPEPAPPATPTVRIATITTDPTALDRYAADSRGDALELIDDAELLAALHDMGHSCGIVRIKGQTLLTCTNTGAF